MCGWRKLWGKCDPHSGEIHALWCHVVDAGMVAEALWDEAFSLALRQVWVEGLGIENEMQGREWLIFLVALHDIGKATPGFQRRCEKKRNELLTMGFDFPAAAGEKHWEATAVVATHMLTAPPPAVKIERWGRRIATIVGRVLGGHHGIFPQPGILRGARAASKWGGETWREARAEIFEMLVDVAGVQGLAVPAGLDIEQPAILMALAGLISVADWIASDEGLFPYCESGPNVQEYVELSRKRAHEAVRKLGWTDIGEIEETWDFEAVTGFAKPNAMQESVIELAGGMKEPGLVIIEAPTGNGKTEAAFWLADSIMAKGDGRGVYLGMPTQATANAMFGRFRAYLERRHGGRANLHLLHSYAALSEEYQQLQGLGQVYSEGVEGGVSGHVVACEWFAPRKRALLASFGVGTADQALLAALRTRHVFVRLFGLTRKVVIFDEIHAYDTYTSRLIDRLLEWLRELGCTVILLSATLPRKRQQELARIYMGGEVETTTDVSYPRVTVVHGGRMENIPVDAEPKPPIELGWVTEDEIAHKIAERLYGGGCAAVVCNTVRKAQETYLKLVSVLWEQGIEVDLFHARYPFEQRHERELQVVKRFGKNGERLQRAVLVATQVIEQSLDVDFDLMVSEIAPVDLLIQRAGRLHRHRERERPKGVGRRELWLVDVPTGEDGTPEFDKAVKAIYAEYLLLRTWLSLQSRERIEEPSNVEELIEAVYGDARPEGLSGVWELRLEEARTKFEKQFRKLETEARKRQVPCPRRPFDVADMTRAPQEEDLEDNLDISNKLRAVTRWSDVPTVAVACLFGGWEAAFLDREGREPVPLEGDIGIEVAVRVLGREVKLTGRRVVELMEEVEVPPAWRRNALLRHLRPAFFGADGCLTDTGGQRLERPVRLRLDDELGIVVESER